MCRWLRRGGRGESQKPDLNEREWPLALLHGVGVWQQPEQRPLWLIGLIWQQGKKRSLKGPSGYSFHHLSCLIWTLSHSHQLSSPLTGSLSPRITFPSTRFNNRLSFPNNKKRYSSHLKLPGCRNCPYPSHRCIWNATPRRISVSLQSGCAACSV